MKSSDKKVLIDFLMQLTQKITYESPHIAELLLADQTSRSTKDQKYDYVPLQIVLFLHMMDMDNKEDEKNTIALRQVLLLMLK